MPRKNFLLDNGEIEFIHKVMREKAFKYESQALRFILQDYQESKEDGNIKNVVQQLNLAIAIIRDIEKNNIQLMDAFNTLLISNNIETCIPLELFESPVFEGSKKYMKERLGKMKQNKDYQNRKRGKR